MYCAIIGDIIKSKNIDKTKRYETQLKMNELFEQLNVKYRKALASKLTLTLGDEFQCLLSDASVCMELIDNIRFYFDELEIRFGVGVGEIYTDIKFEISIGADGPAYWNARKAINMIHSNNDYGRLKIWLCSSVQTKEINLINQIFSLCGFIESTWTKSQKQFIREIILSYGYQKVTQVELYKFMDTTIQNINKKVKTSGYYNYILSKREVSLFMKELINNE